MEMEDEQEDEPAYDDPGQQAEMCHLHLRNLLKSMSGFHTQAFYGGHMYYIFYVLYLIFRLE